MGHCAPGVPPLSPSALYPSMHPPPAQRAGTGAKLPSDCPRGEALLSSLEQDPGSPKKHEVMTTTATTHEHLLGALPMLRAILPSMRHSTEVHPHFTEADPGGHTVYLPVNNKAGLRIQVSPDSKDHAFAICLPQLCHSPGGSQAPQPQLTALWPLSHCQSGSDPPSVGSLSSGAKP